MANFAINPPNSPLTDGRGYVTSPWYRWFSRVQDVLGGDAVAAIAAAPVLTYGATTAFSDDKILTQGAGLSFISGASTLTVALAASGVTAAAYGAAATVPTFTVDTYGRLTAAANVAIAISASAITSGTLVVARGGTGLSTYAVGDIIYASGATTLARLADVATGNVLISGGVGVAPSWGKVDLTAHVSGVLPVANGGTALSTTPTNGQLLIGNGTNYTLATLTGTASQVTVTNGAGTITLSLPSTINVNTSGSAATLTTPRAIYGNNFDGSAAITAIIASTYGGTGNGFTAFSGPATTEKTFTLPNASATILTDNAVVTAAQGGTGVSNSGTITLGGNFTTSGSFTTTLTVTGNTNVTLPTTGTLATLAGSETFTNKTLTSPIVSTTIGVGGATPSASGSGISFPATQSASTDANTLDDYEEGTWTPVLTFATPGDLAVAYTSNSGSYTKIGRQVVIRFQIVTSAFTHTTASGDLTITGVPFTSEAGFLSAGPLAFAGITKATYTNFVCFVPASAATVKVQAAGSGVGLSNVAAADMPTGGSVTLRGVVTFFV